VRAASSRRPGAGFTLVEVLIVVSLLGLVMTALSAAALVLIRVAQDNEVDIDETRAERSLETWLAQDVLSTPNVEPPGTRGGFDLDQLADPCPTGAGENLAVLVWLDPISGDEWIANYRVESTGGDEFEIVRYACGAFADGRTVVVHRIEPVGVCGAADPMATLDATGSLTLEFCLTDDDPPTSVTVGGRNPVEATP
jgi:prepilin-type N-terminal cleavage/methylation domain-containing protein